MFREITNKNEWNELISSNETTDILQMWEWGETKEIEGWKPYRFSYTGEGVTVGAQVLVKTVRFFGKVGYVPHGPFLEGGEYINSNIKLVEEFMRSLTSWGASNGLIAIEIEPKIAKDNSSALACFKNGVITKRNRQPIYKLLLDITQDEDKILSGMKKNTRYNIGYAERKGVEVKTYSLEDENIDEKLSEFYDLLEEMQERSSGYPIRSKKYFKKLFKEFKGTDSIVLFEVSYKGDVIAMNISEFTDVWASSFYAGSNRLHRKVKAPYQLRWQSIKEAKERGCKVYDFWGIIPDSKHHKGYSDHKLSFGGDRVDYVGIIRYSIVWKAYLYEMAIKFHQLMTRLVWR